MPQFDKTRYLMSMILALLWYPTLAAQETPTPETSSTQPTPTAAASQQNGEPKTIHIELSANPTTVDSLRKIADAIAAATEHVQIHEAGTLADNPMQIDAEVRMHPNTLTELVKKTIDKLAELGIVQIRITQSNGRQNMVILTAPADTSWNAVRRLQTKLASLEGFKLDVRVRNNSETPTSTSASAEEPTFLPLSQEIQSQITQLEVDLAVQKLKLESNHPSIRKLEEKLQILRSGVNAEQPTMKRVKVTASNTAEQYPVLKRLLDELRQQEFPITEENKSPIKGVLITVASDFSKEKWTKTISCLLDAGGVREFFVARQVESNVTELTIFVSPQVQWESLQPIQTQLEKLPNLNFKFIRATRDISTMVRFYDDVKDSGPKQDSKVFPLRNIAANEAQKIIVDLFGNDGTTISVNLPTNSLLIRSQPGRMEEIKAILTTLDEKPRENILPPVMKLEDPNLDSSQLSPMDAYRRRLSELEKPVMQLAEKLRVLESTSGKSHPDSVKLRAELRSLVQQTFAARQEIQRAELIEFTRRLKGMQHAIEARDRIANKIVDRRIEELLDPNVKWTLPESTLSAIALKATSTPFGSDPVSDVPPGTSSEYGTVTDNPFSDANNDPAIRAIPSGAKAFGGQVCKYISPVETRTGTGDTLTIPARAVEKLKNATIQLCKVTQAKDGEIVDVIETLISDAEGRFAGFVPPEYIGLFEREPSDPYLILVVKAEGCVSQSRSSLPEYWNNDMNFALEPGK